MKHKKIVYVIIASIVLISIISIVIIKNRKQELNDHTPPEANSILDVLKKKYPDKEYQKIKNEEILTVNTAEEVTESPVKEQKKGFWARLFG